MSTAFIVACSFFALVAAVLWQRQVHCGADFSSISVDGGTEGFGDGGGSEGGGDGGGCGGGCGGGGD